MAMRRRLVALSVLVAAAACRDTGRVDAGALEHRGNDVLLHVTLLGAPADARIAPVRVWPLTLPNALRNVAAHELGHALGLAHNDDTTSLMCGRPASCRPATFASDRPHFFPLTRQDEAQLREHWP